MPLEYWEDIKEDLSAHIFQSEEEEINFYKKTKPSFTSFIEYYTKLYLELCFAPRENTEMSLIFWTEELKKLQKFIDKHVEFINYYRSGKTELDNILFLPLKLQHLKSAGLKIYDIGTTFLTSHDHLVAEYLAQEMFHEYAKNKCQQLKQFLFNK